MTVAAVETKISPSTTRLGPDTVAILAFAVLSLT